VFNSGASLADLGIAEDRAEQLSREAETIGKFLHLLSVEHREPPMAAQDLVAEIPFTPEAAEVHYQRLGRWKGPDASPQAQAESQRFWHDSGLPGIHWLVARLRDERHDDRLHGTASVLADLGPASLGLIVQTLRGEPTSDQALALLWSLGWIGDHHQTEDPLAELVLAQYLFVQNPELREAAARAMRLLPPQRAKTWLIRRLRDESDREARVIIEQELEVSRVVEAEPCIS
jgi:HEAT repeat protein